MLVIAVVAVAALVIGATALNRAGTDIRSAAMPVTASPSAVPTPSADTLAADRALCTATAPLMADYDRTSNEWTGSGPTGTPARDAALPKYRSDTEDWARSSQEALDRHRDASQFFRRTLQRFIDDRILLVHNMEPGPSKPPDDEARGDSMTAYGGPLFVCGKLGIEW
jgi:hypothetical protein